MKKSKINDCKCSKCIILIVYASIVCVVFRVYHFNLHRKICRNFWVVVFPIRIQLITDKWSILDNFLPLSFTMCSPFGISHLGPRMWWLFGHTFGLIPLWEEGNLQGLCWVPLLLLQQGHLSVDMIACWDSFLFCHVHAVFFTLINTTGLQQRTEKTQDLIVLLGVCTGMIRLQAQKGPWPKAWICRFLW